MLVFLYSIKDKENLSRWWGEDKENLRGKPLSLTESSSQGFPYPYLINMINYLSYLFIAYTPI